jgi:hypothetical protein
MAKNPKGVADHPSKTQMEELWVHGWRAKDIVSWLHTNDLPIVAATTIARYGQRYWSKTTVTFEEDTDMVSLQEQVAAINSLGVGTVKKISLRESHTKTGDSTFQTIEITPSVITHPIEQAPPVTVKLKTVKADPEAKAEGWNVGVFLPDMQIGYFTDGKNHTTTHDESAINVAHQIMSYVDSKYGLDLVVNAGDNLDFPAFSSHRSAPGFMNTTQMAIDRASEEAAKQRALAPDARIVWLAGNHDVRLNNYLIDKAPPLVGLHRAGEEVPSLSIPYLCRFDDYNIEYLEPYPDAELWVNDHLRFEHGSVYSSTPGGTAAKQLRNGVSVGYGHIHRQEFLQETRHTAQGPRTHFAGSPGTLCKINGAVPSAKTGITAKGTQAGINHENWQQGAWVFFYQPEGRQLVSIEPVSIWGGWAMFRGTEFTSVVDADGEPL